MEPHPLDPSQDPCSASTWQDVLRTEREKPYFKKILRTIEEDRQSGITVYPPNKEIFNAIQSTPLEHVSVVILGQDPYHGPQQAHGLCFSVRPGVPFPPSLQNIFKELQADVGMPLPKNGCLQSWAQQGVLLLNTVLSVRSGQANSHRDIGWEEFTDAVIAAVNVRQKGVVFLLWGAHAQKKGAGIDRNKHLVLQAPHPSPLSAHRGFLGCCHFTKANEYLRSVGKSPIDWSSVLAD